MNLKIIFDIVLVLGSLKISFSCPSTCSCRGQAARCGSVMSSFPLGLDATVEYLSISGNLTHPNTISSLGKNDFQGTRLLLSLSITFSGVQNIDDEAFSYLPVLRELILADNDIHTLKAETFKGLIRLYALDVSGNKNCTFDKNTFKYISHIEELNIGNMGLKIIPSDLFVALGKLKNLKLRMNELEKIHERLFLPLLSLENLDISGNHLLGLPMELKPRFIGMKAIHFYENPWQCNCQILWLRDLPERFYASQSDTSEIICNGPENLRYQSLINIRETEFVCIRPKVIGCEHMHYSLNESNTLEIACTFGGDPIPEIKWTRPDGFVIDGRETVRENYEINSNGTLWINYVASVDDGDWTVTAYNSTTSDSITVNVHVITTTPISTSTSVSFPTILTTKAILMTTFRAFTTTAIKLSTIPQTGPNSVSPIYSSTPSPMTSQKTTQTRTSSISKEYPEEPKDSRNYYGLVAGTVTAGCSSLFGIVIAYVIYKRKICNKRIDTMPSVENEEHKG